MDPENLLSDPQQQRDEEVEDIIENSYNSNDESLIIYNKPSTWHRVLNYPKNKTSWKNLQILSLEFCQIDSEQIGQIPELANLKQLLIIQSKVGFRGIMRFLMKEWPNLRQLTLCIIFSDQLQTKVTLMMKLLFSFSICTPNYQGCTNQIWENNCITGAAFLQVNQSMLLRNLKTLILDFNNIGERALRNLGKLQLVSLQKLSIKCCMIGNTGYRNLFKAKWPNLSTLMIGFNQISYDGFMGCQMCSLANLKYFHIGAIYCVFLLCFSVMEQHKMCLYFEGVGCNSFYGNWFPSKFPKMNKTNHN